MSAQIHKNDVGTSFRATIKDENGDAVDISSATVKKFIFQPPDEVDIEKTAAFVTDGTDGLVEYISETGFLSQIGVWEYQFYVEFSGGKYHTNKSSFEVLKNLD